MHRNEVAKCRDFERGQCNLDDESCWFIHNEKEEAMEVITLDKTETKDKDAESVFCKDAKKTPPDQKSLLTEIIKQMTIQMKNLEMMTQIN